MTIALEGSALVFGGDDSSHTSASWSPQQDELLLLGIAWREDKETISSVSGNGQTWVEVADVTNTQGQNRLAVYRTMDTSGTPSSGAITVTFSDVTEASCVAIRLSGVDTSGTNGSGAVEATANDPGPASDNDDMKVDITTVTADAWALAYGTHRNDTFTVPGDETAISINNYYGSGGSQVSNSCWYDTVATPTTYEIGADNDLDDVSDWVIIAVSVKPGAPPAPPDIAVEAEGDAIYADSLQSVQASDTYDLFAEQLFSSANVVTSDTEFTTSDTVGSSQSLSAYGVPAEAEAVLLELTVWGNAVGQWVGIGPATSKQHLIQYTQTSGDDKCSIQGKVKIDTSQTVYISRNVGGGGSPSLHYSLKVLGIDV